MVTDNFIEININDLHKHFGDKKVLCGIDLTFYSGELISIVGGSGSGKTVLLNTILGQYPPDQGDIFVVDHSQINHNLKNLLDFNNFEIDDIHKHWGVVFQRNALFSGTVYKNIALWLREVKGFEEEVIQSIARNALKDVGLPSDDDFLNTEQSDLSGGMAKRLAIARALSMNPNVIFYDEPTTGLDPTSSEQIHNLILKTHDTKLPDNTHRTTIIITHDKDLLSRLKPRIIMLHKGKVFFDGTFDEFESSDSGIIRPYFELMPVLDQRYIEEIPQIPEPEKRKGLLL